METMTTNDGEVYEGTGNAELVIGCLVMLAGLGLFVYAFEMESDGLSTAIGAWLIAFAASAVGVFLWSNGMRKQRIAKEIAEQRAAERKLQADADSAASDAIERARKK